MIFFSKPTILYLLFSLVVFPSFASWQMEVKNVRIGRSDTQVYFQNTTQEEVEVEISAKLQGSNQQVFHATLREVQDFQTFSLHLGRGNYVFTMDCIQPKTGEIETFTYLYACRNSPSDFYAADILLSEKPIEHLAEAKPMLGTRLAEGQKKLYFHQALISSEKNLTARAILYQETQGSEIPEATTYLSVGQINRVLNFESNSMVFTGDFDLTNLPTGKYLLEILVYSDTKLLSEKSCTFEREWEGWKNVWENIDAYITEMQYVTNSDTVKKLLVIADAGQKKAALWQVWQQLYPNDYEAQAKRFFEKCSIAQQRFPSLTDKRRRIFLQYGEPTSIEHKAKEEIWFYAKWNLRFRFP
ncbi:MAG: GWxTD domain-containing protein [Bacteroidia bacterium]